MQQPNAGSTRSSGLRLCPCLCKLHLVAEEGNASITESILCAHHVCICASKLEKSHLEVLFYCEEKHEHSMRQKLLIPSSTS